MNKIIDYYTINASNSTRLDQYVADAMAEGWQPFGGVAVAAYVNENGGISMVFAQAMVKYAEPGKQVAP